MKNILYNKKIRRKRGTIFCRYYESEKITLKEKLYTFWYNLHRFQKTTKGESEWALDIQKMIPDLFNKYEDLFEKDYAEFTDNPKMI